MSDTELVGIVPPPEGVTPDFHGVSAVQKRFITVYSATLWLAVVSLVVRVYTRTRINKTFGVDDCMSKYYCLL